MASKEDQLRVRSRDEGFITLEQLYQDWSCRSSFIGETLLRRVGSVASTMAHFAHSRSKLSYLQLHCFIFWYIYTMCIYIYVIYIYIIIYQCMCGFHVHLLCRNGNSMSIYPKTSTVWQSLYLSEICHLSWALIARPRQGHGHRRKRDKQRPVFSRRQSLNHCLMVLTVMFSRLER